LRFLSKSKDQLMAESKNYLVENTELRNFKPGSVIRSILESINGHIAEQYEIMTMNLLQTYITTAVGDALDEIGALFSLTRNESQRAVDTSHNNFKFYIDSLTGYVAQTLSSEQYTANQNSEVSETYVHENSFTVPAGTTVFAGDITYKTTEDAVFSGSTVDVYVPVVASGYGPAFNIPAYQLKSYTLGIEFSIISKYLYCENTQTINSGKFQESDDEFRYRIIHAHVGSAKSNETSVRLAALSIPGVIDVILREYAAGIGTFAVHVIAESPIPNVGLLSAVQQAVDSTRAFGIKALAQYPDYKGFEGTFKLRFVLGTTTDEKVLIMQQVRIAAELYINNLGFGGEFIANELIQRIMEVNDKIKDVSVVAFGAGDYNPLTGINENYGPLIFMNQTCGPDEMCIATPGGIVIC